MKTLLLITSLSINIAGAIYFNSHIENKFTQADMEKAYEHGQENFKYIENYCMHLDAKRGSKTQDTIDFEKAGCCYNDGLTEPKGC